MSRSPLKANYTGRGIAAITGSVGGSHIERAAVAAEGYDSDDPAVVAALARVSAAGGTREGRKNCTVALAFPQPVDNAAEAPPPSASVLIERFSGTASLSS